MPRDPSPFTAGRRRWWGLAAGVAWAVVDTLLAATLGISFTIAGEDATWVVALFFGSSFALLGFLIGYAMDARTRDAQAAALIREQADALAATRVRLAQSEKLAALGQLASAIAHEVRNPLAVMRSAAQGLVEAGGPVDAETRRASDFITAEIDRLSNVVTSLLAFARPVQVRRRRVSVPELLERTEQLARDEVTGADVRLARREPTAHAVLHGDPDLICQVLLGLVTNAVEAMDGRGDVLLEAETRGGSVEIAVADSGPGVSPEFRARIFEPFFTTRPKGTGLGLAVARQIVEAHAGTISVQDRPGGGARFVVRLPVARDVPEAA
jgi:two-component system sensor histidine kinase HydH